jgi:hypothetical protein
VQLQAQLHNTQFDGGLGTGIVTEGTDGPGNDAWQKSVMLNAQLNAQNRRN